MTIQGLYDGFVLTKEKCALCIQQVCDPSFMQDNTKAAIRDFVISFAFLEVFKAWEYFLEQSFISYTLKKPSIMGNCPVCYSSPTNREHAYQMIAGSAKYPDWTSHETVIKLSETFFEDGKPYKPALQSIASKLQEAKKIRNAISHNSQKSKETFNSLVRNKLSASQTGISVSNFLISKKKSDPYFYDLYFTYFNNAAQIIANY